MNGCIADISNNTSGVPTSTKLKWATADKVLYELISASARQMRRQPTLAEEVLWQHLRGNQTGLRFRRQHVIDRYIADFICLPAKLIIEVDRCYHSEPEQTAYDEGRTFDLATLGYTVLRFANEEVLHQTASVLARIRQHLP